MNVEVLREWWWRRQGLDGSWRGAAPAAVLERSGWARSVGGCGPYLTLFARAGTTRATADAAVAVLDIHELPAARRCTYVVPRSDYPLALRAGQANAANDVKTAVRAGATEKEIDRACEAVVTALGAGALAPEEIRERCGDAIRSLGPEGQKKGLASTLPVTLVMLQSRGAIRRVPVGGRLDQQRYKYALWKPNPLDGYDVDDEELAVDLGRKFFAWIGPATVGEFRAFSGLGVKAAKAAIATLGLVEVEERYILPEDAEELRTFRRSREPQYALVGSLDSIALLRGGLQGVLDPSDAARIPGKAGGFGEPPSHMILDRGRLAGLWEYDPESESIIWMSFVARNKELEAAVERTEAYVREQLGDARGYSLDSPKSRRPRIDALRASA